MTVSSTTPLRVQYNGNGATTAFTVTFPFTKVSANQSNIEVIVTTVSTGAEVTKTEVTHYTVTGGAITGSPATGTVTFLVAPATGERITIHGIEPNTQGLNLIEGGDQPSGAIERQLDSLTLQVQGLAEELTRAIVFSVGSTPTDITVQSPVEDSVLYWVDSSTIGSLDQDSIAAPISLSSTGMLACTSLTSPRTYAGRTITAPAAGISVTNGDGVSGNPTLALTNDLSAVEGLSGTGIAVRTASDTWTTRTITVSNGVSITNGDGISGNPALTLDITGLTVDASPDATADYMVTYDASAATNKKVLLSTITGASTSLGISTCVSTGIFNH